jgi:endonuclease/exonuclease/phosphatase family metal-dependent hydrolase
MKIISLNIWNGRQHSELELLLNKYSCDTEIFCLQEVFPAHNTQISEKNLDTPDKIKKILGASYSMITDDNGLVICFKNELRMKDWGIVEVFSQGDFKKNILWTILKSNEKECLVATVHGIWVKDSKEDTPERLRQSEIIKSLLDKYKIDKILCGDFNLLPNTKSIEMLEGGLTNLIKEYRVQTTRTQLKKHTNQDEKTKEFADYMFTSLDIKVKDFKVLPEEVSDHFALMVEIE